MTAVVATSPTMRIPKTNDTFHLAVSSIQKRWLFRTDIFSLQISTFFVVLRPNGSCFIDYILSHVQISKHPQHSFSFAKLLRVTFL